MILLKKRKNFLFLILAFLSFTAFSCKKETAKFDNLEQSVSLSKQSATLFVGDELILRPEFALGVTPQRSYTWSTDNTQVLNISVNGDNSATITAKQKGNATLVVSSTDGKLSASCQIVIKEAVPDDGVLRVLTIGNSFSEDAVEHYLYGLAKASNEPIVIGNLFVGGAHLDSHWESASNNTANYSYRKINQQGSRTVTANTAIATAILDEEWDYISFQQGSRISGQYSTYVTALPLLLNYVKQKATNPKVKYILHQTWAYAQNSTHSGFVNYDRDQAKMYTAIVNAVEQAKKLVDIDMVVPSGTAIQNGRASVIGDNFCRDGYHLDLNIGRYTASCTWFEALFGKSVVGNTYKPASLSPYETEIAQQAAHFAVLKPNEINPMTAYQEREDLGTLTRPVFIDFGQSTAPQPGWNALSGLPAGTSIGNLKDDSGNFTGVSLTITERFNGENTTNGEANTTTDFFMPQSVSSAYYFGNSKLEFSNILIEKSELKLSRLDKNKKYKLCFFGSRASVSDNRETKYTVAGKNEVACYLNASSNKSTTACADKIEPNSNGEITVTITSGDNNNNPNGFYYINAMRLMSN